MLVGACERRRRRSRRPRRRFFPSPLHRVDKNVASLLLLEELLLLLIFGHTEGRRRGGGPPPNSIPQREEGRGGRGGRWDHHCGDADAKKSGQGGGGERKKKKRRIPTISFSYCRIAPGRVHRATGFIFVRGIFFFGVSCKDKNVFSEREKYTGNLQPPPPLPRLRRKLFCALQKRLAACKSN